MDRDILPAEVKPLHYAISLHDLELGGAFAYQGNVSIDIGIEKSTPRIVLNAEQLKLHSAKVVTELSKTEQTFTASEISYDTTAQRVSLQFPSDLPVTSKATLKIEFSGIMNNEMAGFYRSKYKPVATPAPSVAKDGDYHCMFSTQFESCDARRAFPCFDEPNLKATFDFEIEIPEDQVALSNQPEKGVKKTKSGLKTVSFETTPVMSTYLLAWAFGDFEYVEDFTKRKYNGKPLPVRVYTTRGLKAQGEFALKNAHQVIDYFSEIFGIDYPLPKSDLLAVHEFTYGAMENWGLVTYRTTAVLFDEVNSDASYKIRVAYIVAHELAHQWFGNLVTMDWWSELWLNEGFATWVGWLAIDHLYPEWDVWARFVNDSVENAFEMDSVRSSHPIEVPVKSALDIDQIFDAISYRKGSSVLRMLCDHLGKENFLGGVSAYLKTHAYGNATTNDLWAALSNVSGQDVNSFMDNWIRKIGFPVITVAEEPGQISLRQSRFLSTGDAKANEDETLWWIPLGLKTASDTSSSHPQSLSKREDTIRDIDDSFYKINANTSGFYRTNYPPARLAKLGAARSQLSIEDRIGLIGDAGALAISGNGTTAGLLALVEGFQDEKHYLVWVQILASLGHLRTVFADDTKVYNGVKNYILKLITPLTESLGWSFPADEDFLTGQLRSLLITTAGSTGHQGVIKEAKRQFDLYASGRDPKAIHPNLRLAVFRTAVAEGGKPAYETVKKDYLNTTLTEGKEIALGALGRTQDPELINDFIDFIFSDNVASQDVHSGAGSLAANPKARLALWHRFKDNWDAVRAITAGSSTVLNRFVRVSLANFSDLEVEKDIANFFKGKDNKGYDRTLGVISDTIRGNANYKERDGALALEWLQSHGYA
ncbi:MAG: hypothetical protein M4579_006048 [Chaenotheca gracillima]|nr:MAG: hypothetical protein M4579_006048 [Chaenotheca gracillima]